MKCQILFSGENNKNIFNLLSFGLAQRGELHLHNVCELLWFLLRKFCRYLFRIHLYIIIQIISNYEDIMPDCPADQNCQKFADYLLS